MTITRKAKVVASKERGFLVDGWGTMDGNPDRTNITIEGIDCTVHEFLECFLYTEEGSDFCSYEDGTLIDIGGSSLDVSDGVILETCTDDILPIYRRVKNEIEQGAKLNKETIDMTGS